MGLYLNAPRPQGKAKWLVEQHGATILPFPAFRQGDEVTVCVVDNGPFEAAGVAFSQREFAMFNDPDDFRRKVWLSLPFEKFKALVGDEGLKRFHHYAELDRRPVV